MRPLWRRAHGHGHGLLAALLLATLTGAAGLLAQGELAARARALAQARSMAALAQAREALLGYAVSYAETHQDQGLGYLPCPDSDNDGSPDGACGARGLGQIGRLPWRTLGLTEARDGFGECLWYAVAGSVKNNPKPERLNWDSPGQFELLTETGEPLPVAAQDGLAVAVVFAPGPPLTTQLRAGGPAGTCGGSADAAADLAHYLDRAYPHSIDGPLTLQQGSTGSEARNDLVAWIGIDDIFDALRRRDDHAGQLDDIARRAATALAGRLDDASFIASHAAPTPGGLLTGALPAAAVLGMAETGRAAHDNWRDQFRFAACADGSACIEVEHDAPAETVLCRAVLLFGGERIRAGAGRQVRDTPARRADPTQYLEGDNAVHVALGVPTFAGARRFRVTAPSQPASEDVVLCIA